MSVCVCLYLLLQLQQLLLFLLENLQLLLR